MKNIALGVAWERQRPRRWEWRKRKGL